MDTKATLEYNGCKFELDLVEWNEFTRYGGDATISFEGRVVKKVLRAILRRTSPSFSAYTMETKTPYVVGVTPGYASAMRPFASWNGEVWRFPCTMYATALALLKHFYGDDCEIVDETR